MLKADWVGEVFPTADLAQFGGILPVGSARRRAATNLTGRIADAGLGAHARATRMSRDLDTAADRAAPARVDVLSIYGPDPAGLVANMPALRSSRHDVRFAFGAMGDPDPRLGSETTASEMAGSKFANLNRLLATSPGPAADWTVILDDDVALPVRFLDRLIGIAEALGFDLAQPAQSWTSDAAWRITRRRRDIARTTRFVEVGPVCLMRREVLEAVTPFSEQGMGWGLCMHWAALAKREDWRLGIVDALAVRHESRPVASAYSREDALTAARSFLETHEHIDRDTAGEVVETHTQLPGAGSC